MLRTVEYGETSRIVTLFTRERGKLGVMARGARGPKSRFGATLEPMAYVQVVVWTKPSRDLQTLSEASHLRLFPGLTRSMERMEGGIRAIELVNALMQAEQSHAPALELLVECLTALDTAEERIGNIWPFFSLRLASYLGLSPALNRAAVEAIEESGSLRLDTGHIAAGPSDGDAIRASRAALRAFAILARADLQTVLRMNLDPAVRQEVEDLVDAYLRYHVEDAYPSRAARVFDGMHGA